MSDIRVSIPQRLSRLLFKVTTIPYKPSFLISSFYFLFRYLLVPPLKAAAHHAPQLSHQQRHYRIRPAALFSLSCPSPPPPLRSPPPKTARLLCLLGSVHTRLSQPKFGGVELLYCFCHLFFFVTKGPWSILFAQQVCLFVAFPRCLRTVLVAVTIGDRLQSFFVIPGILSSEYPSTCLERL